MVAGVVQERPGGRRWRPVTHETWISIDVETSGPTPSTGSLLSIGACLVDRPEEGIELLLRPDPDLPWSDEAATVHHLDRAVLARDGMEPRAAMEALEAWVRRVAPAGSRPVLVALNAAFDWMFVADAFWRRLGRNPFGISETTRLRMLERYPVSLPHTHRALDDAREQALLCREILAAARPDAGTGG
jgi:DNA polymerase III epsilon subunit-like protein